MFYLAYTKYPILGGGGGSFSIASTKSSDLSPTAKQDNPCGSIGCVRIGVVAP